MTFQLLCILLAVVGVAQSCQKFYSGQFAKEHKDSWTLDRVNDECELEFTQSQILIDWLID